MPRSVPSFSNSSHRTVGTGGQHGYQQHFSILKISTVLFLLGAIWQLSMISLPRDSTISLSSARVILIDDETSSNSNNIKNLQQATSNHLRTNLDDNDNIEALAKHSADQGNDDLSSYRICRVPPEQTVGYVCRGDEYDQFSNKFTRLVQTLGPQRPSSWGKRLNPFPHDSVTLVVGNSLTRQIFQGMSCQYGDGQLVDWIDRESNRTNEMRRGTFYEGTFRNNAKVFLVTNHAMFYTPKWPTYLQELIGMPIDNVDTLIVGHINHFMNAYNTSFMELMMEQTKKYDGANFESVPPPTLIDFARIYKEIPIVGISMMADWSSYDQDYYEMADQVHTINDPSRVRLIHGRRYINDLGECGSNDWMNVGICTDAPDMHRCIGTNGGHPDLILWDTLEAVHEIYRPTTKLNKI